MSGAQPRRSCTVCAFMVEYHSVEIDAWNSRTISLPPSGRALLGADLSCSESRRAPPTLCRERSDAPGDCCTAGFQPPPCPLRVRSGHLPLPYQCPLCPSKRTKRSDVG